MTAMTANMYVENHMTLLSKYSNSIRFRPYDMEPDEFKSELVIGVLEKYDTFREVENARSCPYCDRLGCSTWLGWRARKVESMHYRKCKTRMVVEFTAVTVDRLDILADYGSSYGSESRVFAKAQISEILSRATPAQTEALISKLEGWTGDEVWDQLGISIHGRNYRLKTLMQNIERG